VPVSDLRGRVALVTGGSGGIGGALCRQLGEAGARVAVGYLNREAEARHTAASCGHDAIAVRADVRDPAAIARLVEEVEAGLGPVDILVSNAGRVEVLGLDEIDANKWDDTFAEHVRAAFLLCQAVLPGMRERSFGRILLMSSSAAFVGGFVGPHYAAAKSAIFGLTHWLASNYARDGITVNAIAPSLIDTPVLGDEERRARLLKRIPLGRFGTVDETAEMMLAMLANAYLNSQTVMVDGGARGTP
jgi:3-oxoacyl-[acyl-carrier protein] reductase